MPEQPRYYQRCGSGKRPKFAAFDFETEGLDGKLLAASYMTEEMLTNGHAPGYITGTPQQIFDKTLAILCENCDHHWFAHNAQYELRYFLKLFREEKQHIQYFMRTHNDFFMIKADLHAINPNEFEPGDCLVIRDSAAIWQGDLRSMLDTFCPNTPKGTIDFQNGEIFDPKNPIHIAYSQRDSEGLLLALLALDQSIYEKFDVHMRYTAAGTALQAWQRTLHKGTKYFNDETNETEIRKAYFGGLCFLTSNDTHEHARTYDINSSYPTQMLRHNMPIGNARRTFRYLPGVLGVYHVTVTAPDNLIIPIIPVRDEKGIAWPSGTFDTHTTNIEMKFAITKGYSFKVITGLVWSEEYKPFKQFIEKCMTLRHEHGKGSAYDTTAKLMQNSLYGKFASRRMRRVFYGEKPDDTNNFTEWGDFYVREEYQEKMQCLPQWSVFVTANARLQLLRTAYECGAENVIYGDTDSITIKSCATFPAEYIDEKTYGSWKLEKTWETFRAHAPKCYSGKVAVKNKQTGEVEEKIIGAAKGIPRKQWKKSGILEAMLNETALSTAPIPYKTLPKLTAIMKRANMRGERDATRTLTDIGKSRSWVPMPGRKIRPRNYQSLSGDTGPGEEARSVCDPGAQSFARILAKEKAASIFTASGVIRIKRVVVSVD